MRAANLACGTSKNLGPVIPPYYDINKAFLALCILVVAGLWKGLDLAGYSELCKQEPTTMGTQITVFFSFLFHPYPTIEKEKKGLGNPPIVSSSPMKGGWNGREWDARTSDHGPSEMASR